MKKPDFVPCDREPCPEFPQMVYRRSGEGGIYLDATLYPERIGADDTLTEMCGERFGPGE
jgi:hypothetical protein